MAREIFVVSGAYWQQSSFSQPSYAEATPLKAFDDYEQAIAYLKAYCEENNLRLTTMYKDANLESYIRKMLSEYGFVTTSDCASGPTTVHKFYVKKIPYEQNKEDFHQLL